MKAGLGWVWAGHHVHRHSSTSRLTMERLIIRERLDSNELGSTSRIRVSDPSTMSSGNYCRTGLEALRFVCNRRRETTK